jgi:hypothetical protein
MGRKHRGKRDESGGGNGFFKSGERGEAQGETALSSSVNYSTRDPEAQPRKTHLVQFHRDPTSDVWRTRRKSPRAAPS